MFDGERLNNWCSFALPGPAKGAARELGTGLSALFSRAEEPDDVRALRSVATLDVATWRPRVFARPWQSPRDFKSRRTRTTSELQWS